jgi:hypothetical protein
MELRIQLPSLPASDNVGGYGYDLLCIAAGDDAK